MKQVRNESGCYAPIVRNAHSSHLLSLKKQNVICDFSVKIFGARYQISLKNRVCNREHYTKPIEQTKAMQCFDCMAFTFSRIISWIYPMIDSLGFVTSST